MFRRERERETGEEGAADDSVVDGEDAVDGGIRVVVVSSLTRVERGERERERGRGGGEKRRERGATEIGRAHV